MIYLIVFIVLMGLELLYFKMADRYNIIDKPNERSSHSNITLRGGGIVFYFAASIYFIYSGFAYPYFFLGLSLLALISFLDDIFTLSNKVRILIHVLGVLLLCYELQIFQYYLWLLVPLLIFIIGILNAYNFMDGINGITVTYSLAVLIGLLLINVETAFIDKSFLYFIALSCVVFGYFNFRDRAYCFAGDIGSISMAAILSFCIGLLVLKTGNPIYILLLAVYGVDTILTILYRLRRKENIFKAHRSHLYQYLSNESGYNKLYVALGYGILQLGIAVLLIPITSYDFKAQMIFGVLLILILSAVYIFWKQQILKKINLQSTS